MRFTDDHLCAFPSFLNLEYIIRNPCLFWFTTTLLAKPSLDVFHYDIFSVLRVSPKMCFIK